MLCAVDIADGLVLRVLVVIEELAHLHILVTLEAFTVSV